MRAALQAGVPAAQVYPHAARASDAHPNEVRIAFDGDAVLFGDEAEQVFAQGGLDALYTTKPSTPRSRCPMAPSSPCWRRCTRYKRPTRLG